MPEYRLFGSKKATVMQCNLIQNKRSKPHHKLLNSYT